MSPVFFLSLWALACGNLIIDIDVTTEPPYIDVRNFISTDVISDAERTTFGIDDTQLKTAVAKYTNDSTEPNYVYVKKTGEENDLYAKYDFEEIKRIVKPIYVDAEIDSSGCVDKPGGMGITTNWNINGTLTIADKIKHIVYYNNNLTITKESAWGENLIEQIPAIDDDVGVCTMSVTIKYETTISGDVVADYKMKRPSKDGDHHFYAYDVFNVQEAAGLKKCVVSYETITVHYPKVNPV